MGPRTKGKIKRIGFAMAVFSDPPKLDSARASAILFGRSFGQICFGKNFHHSAKAEAAVTPPKLLLEQKPQLITKHCLEYRVNLADFHLIQLKF